MAEGVRFTEWRAFGVISRTCRKPLKTSQEQTVLRSVGEGSLNASFLESA